MGIAPKGGLPTIAFDISKACVGFFSVLHLPEAAPAARLLLGGRFFLLHRLTADRLL